MNNPFLNRLVREDEKDIVHSSVYAKAQGNGGIGADSTESFARRREIDKNRMVVRRYDDSKIVEESGVRDKNARKYRKGYGADGDDKGLVGLKQRLNKDNTGETRCRMNKGEMESGKRKYSFTEPQSGGKPTTVPPVRRNPGISR